MEGYYVVMARPLFAGSDPEHEEYTGIHWPPDHELEAHDELWMAQHDGEVEDAYIREVIM